MKTITQAVGMLRRASSACALLVLSGFGGTRALATDATAPPPVASPMLALAPTPAKPDGSQGGTAQEIETSRQQLRGLEDRLSSSESERHRMLADIESIRTDRVRLSAALLETAQKVRDDEQKVATVESRLDTMQGSQDAIRQSLAARRGVIAEVLAALQRMGRKPPPALLVSPDDILKTLRTSMLLGSVVPELRQEADALASDLAELQRLRQAIATERDGLALDIAGLDRERDRLDALVAARQAAQAQAEAALGTEQSRGADLARQATSLKDLINRLETDVTSSRRAADAARAADDERRKTAQADADSIREKVAAGPFRDPARLSPAVDFTDTKALLSFPVSGHVVKAFGAADEFGGTEKGLSIDTRPQAVVSTPADGWVAYSGPYRTYGQILIINVGSGYHIVLAGLAQVNVAQGQFVLAGEPVGAMGDGTVKTAASISLGASDPILYVEFRKDGTAVDPGPWWAKAELEKVRG